jgi:hypothetical protein
MHLLERHFWKLDLKPPTPRIGRDLLKSSSINKKPPRMTSGGNGKPFFVGMPG